MTTRSKKNDFVRQLAARMSCDEATAAAWLEAVIETLYQMIKSGQSITLPGLGGFYVRPERTTWVFRFNPSQRLRALFGWSSTFKGNL